MAQEKRFNIVSLTDAHFPYQDKKAVNLAFNFCEYLQPDIIILHEWHDFYALSKFDKDPLRMNNLQGEIDGVNVYLDRLRTLCPKSRMIMLNSNHLERLVRYLWRQAPALATLRALQIESLLSLKSLNIEFMEDFEYRKVLFKHGDIVRKYASYTGKGEFDKEGLSGVSGHTHRLGIHYSTKRGGKYCWVESGCLCDTNPEYIKGTADWQQGLSVVSFRENSNHFLAMPIPIIDYKISIGFNGDIIL